MAKRPMCLLCFLMVLSLGALELMGIPLIKGNPLPLNVQEQIEAHPGSMICGEVEQYENTEFSQSVYLKKTYLIHQSKKFPIENVRIFLKKEEDLKPGMRILVKGTLKRVEGPANPGGFDSQHFLCLSSYLLFYEERCAPKENSSVFRLQAAPFGDKRKLQTDPEGSSRKRCACFLCHNAWRQTGTGSGNTDALSAGRNHTYPCHQRTSYQYSWNGLYNLLKKMGLGIWPAGSFFSGSDAAVWDHDRRECFHHACSNYVFDRHGSQDHRTDL